MKVAYLINQYPQLSHTFIRREIQALERQGIQVVRISLRHPGIQVEEADRAEAARTWIFQRAGIAYCLLAVVSVLGRHPIRLFRAASRAIAIGLRSRSGAIKHAFYLLEACLLERYLRQEAVDHVHAHFGTNSASVALMCFWLGGPKFSFTVHGPEEFDDAYGLALPVKIRDAAFVVGISDFGRSQLLRHCDVGQWGKVHIVRCGVDRSYFGANLVPPASTPRFVCVGRLAEQKGHLLMLQALSELQRRGIEFEISLIGDGPLRGAIEAEISGLKLSDRVHLLGSQDQSRVRTEILAARAFALPSFAEGLPVVIMEALALGRPVISTYVAGIPELVDSRTGWLVPAGSVEHLTDALEASLRVNAAELATMGNEGRRRVAQMHDVDREASRLVAHFFAAHATNAVTKSATTASVLASPEASPRVAASV